MKSSIIGLVEELVKVVSPLVLVEAELVLDLLQVLLVVADGLLHLHLLLHEGAQLGLHALVVLLQHVVALLQAVELGPVLLHLGLQVGDFPLLVDLVPLELGHDALFLLLACLPQQSLQLLDPVLVQLVLEADFLPLIQGRPVLHVSQFLFHLFDNLLVSL